MPANDNFGFSAGNAGNPECIAVLPFARAMDNPRYARISCQPGADISEIRIMPAGQRLPRTIMTELPGRNGSLPLPYEYHFLQLQHTRRQHKPGIGKNEN